MDSAAEGLTRRVERSLSFAADRTRGRQLCCKASLGGRRPLAGVGPIGLVRAIAAIALCALWLSASPARGTVGATHTAVPMAGAAGTCINQARAVNDLGDAGGLAYFPGSQAADTSHMDAFYWHAGSLLQLPAGDPSLHVVGNGSCSDGINYVANDINASGTAVGWAYFKDPNPDNQDDRLAAEWPAGANSATSLGLLPSATPAKCFSQAPSFVSEADAINAGGDITGNSTFCTGSGFAQYSPVLIPHGGTLAASGQVIAPPTSGGIATQRLRRTAHLPDAVGRRRDGRALCPGWRGPPAIGTRARARAGRCGSGSIPRRDEPDRSWRGKPRGGLPLGLRTLATFPGARANGTEIPRRLRRHGRLLTWAATCGTVRHQIKLARGRTAVYLRSVAARAKLPKLRGTYKMTVTALGRRDTVLGSATIKARL